MDFSCTTAPEEKNFITKKVVPAVKKALPVAQKVLPIASKIVPGLAPIAAVVSVL